MVQPIGPGATTTSPSGPAKRASVRGSGAPMAASAARASSARKVNTSSRTRPPSMRTSTDWGAPSPVAAQRRRVSPATLSSSYHLPSPRGAKLCASSRRFMPTCTPSTESPLSRGGCAEPQPPATATRISAVLASADTCRHYTALRMADYERAFFFLLDGARVDVLSHLLARGELPNVSRYLAERGSSGQATSVFPTVTGVAYIPFVTGRFPGPANIPGIRWFDREKYGRTLFSVSRFRNYNGWGSYLMDRDLAPETRTLFELLPPASNIFSGISRGTGLRRNAAYFRRIPYVYHFFRTGDWDPIDRQGRGFLLRAAARRRERFTFHTTLSVDEYSHRHGPFAKRVTDAYRAFDQVIGELSRALSASGQLDRSLLVLSADHGHTEVAQHLDLEGFFERRGLSTLYFPFAPQRWFACDVAVMVGGNGMAHVSLRGRRGWRVRPSGDELLAEHAGLADDLLGEDAVHLLAWRAADPTDAIRVRTRTGEALVRTYDGSV